MITIYIGNYKCTCVTLVTITVVNPCYRACYRPCSFVVAAAHRVVHMCGHGGRVVRHSRSSGSANRHASAPLPARTPLLLHAAPCAGDHACPCVHVLASLIVSSLGACAQAQRPHQPCQLAGRAGRVGRSQQRCSGFEVGLPHPRHRSPQVL